MHTVLHAKNDATRTKWRLKLAAILFHPTNWKDKWRVSICPEVVAFRVSIKVKTESVAFHLSNTEYTIQWRMYWINAFQLHSNLESILCRWKSLAQPQPIQSLIVVISKKPLDTTKHRTLTHYNLWLGQHPRQLVAHPLDSSWTPTVSRISYAQQVFVLDYSSLTLTP